VTLRLGDLQPCFQGVVPSVMATCGRDGEPNVTYISQVYYVDDRHVALSCQFFNKTRRNVAENPYASVILHDPISFQAYRLRLRFVREEASGPLFDTMAARIQVIASHTGMAGVFRLRSADVYEVLAADPVAEFLLPPDPVLDAVPVPSPSPSPLSELHRLQVVSARIAAARDLDELLGGTLAALAELFGFAHSMVLLARPGEAHGAGPAERPALPGAIAAGAGEAGPQAPRRLVTVASHGYGGTALGAEVGFGEGLIGTAAEHRRVMQVAGMGAELRYGRAIRDRMAQTGESSRLSCEVPLPGLATAQAQLALPLLAGERLVGVLAVESADPLCFDEWDEAYLQIVASQIAIGIDRIQGAATPPPSPVGAPIVEAGREALVHTFVFYRNDDCIFFDGDYLVRNVPAKILWRILRRFMEHGQREFSNRELRLDDSLGLPAYRDNLESRLILLRRRLEEKRAVVRLVPVRRGRFALEVEAPFSLDERDST
jgi:adenylate cyclase